MLKESTPSDTKNCVVWTQHALEMDFNYLTDANGTTFMLLNLVDLGSEYQMECVLRGGGYRKHLVTQGLDNRGVLANELPAGGVHVRTIGPQAPYNPKKSNTTVEFGNLPEGKSLSPNQGDENMRMLLAEANSVVNGKRCAGEFSLDQ